LSYLCSLYKINILEENENTERFLEKLIKEIFDKVVAFIAFIILLPLLGVVAILIKLDSKGSVLFLQERMGKEGKIFKIIKFRSMKEGSNSDSVINEVTLDDPRITKLGRFLRRFQIDELPQLVNIIKGDMSFVGPRPTLPKQFKGYNKGIKERFLMKPGLTGLTQVNGNKQLLWNERIEYDKYYVKHFSLLLDCKILLKTFLIVIFGEDKFKRGMT